MFLPWIVKTTELPGKRGRGGGRRGKGKCGKASARDRSRSKHFHGEKDAEVDKDETCQKEGANNRVTSSRTSTAVAFLASQCSAPQTMLHRNRQMHLQVLPFQRKMRQWHRNASNDVPIGHRNCVRGSRIRRHLAIHDQSNRWTRFVFQNFESVLSISDRELIFPVEEVRWIFLLILEKLRVEKVT